MSSSIFRLVVLLLVLLSSLNVLIAYFQSPFRKSIFTPKRCRLSGRRDRCIRAPENHQNPEEEPLVLYSVANPNPKPMVIGDVQYPPNIFTSWSSAELKAIGLYEISVDESNLKDNRYYQYRSRQLFQDSYLHTSLSKFKTHKSSKIKGRPH